MNRFTHTLVDIKYADMPVRTRNREQVRLFLGIAQVMSC